VDCFMTAERLRPLRPSLRGAEGDVAIHLTAPKIGCRVALLAMTMFSSPNPAVEP
jgi:hypothetical protein